MHVYKAEEWQGASGRWYAADVKDLAHNSAVWWIPPQILGVSYEDYINKLVKEFNVTEMNYHYDTNTLVFSWDNKTDAHKYVLYINKVARNKNFTI